MRKAALILCMVTAVFFLASTGFAQYPYQEFTKGEGACKGDIQKFCSGIERGDGKVWNCLKKNESQLSKGCQKDMAKAREKAKEFKEACADDVKGFCKGKQPGKGELIVCLKANEGRISAPCKSFLEQ